jgi:hypothetical protein
VECIWYVDRQNDDPQHEDKACKDLTEPCGGEDFCDARPDEEADEASQKTDPKAAEHYHPPGLMRELDWSFGTQHLTGNDEHQQSKEHLPTKSQSIS